MRLLFVRHADPDYARDSLTPAGWEEAALLADRLAAVPCRQYYLSPLGRARDTAFVTLDRLPPDENRRVVTLPWLREFGAPARDPRTGNFRTAWDWLPEDWTKHTDFYDKDAWHRNPHMLDGKVTEEVRFVTEGLDAVLAENGYRRAGNLYRAEKPNEETLVFFCHFGVICVMLGHLLGLSPMVLWHGTMAAPSSVTTVWTEERRRGIAAFRMSAFGDVSHLYAAGREPSFAGRFCEIFDRFDQRHD